MTTTNDKLKTLGRLYRKTDKNGKEYFAGTMMTKNLKDAEVFTDKFNNSKIGIVIYTNGFKKSKDDGEADYIVYESRKPKPKTEENPFQ